MNATRRDFIRVVTISGGALVLGVRLRAEEGGAGEAAVFQPDAWLRIEADGTIVVQIGKSEMGQGVRTSLPMIVAEELDVDPSAIRLEQAQPGPKFDDLGTGGSSSHEDLWEPLRRAGATARAMLVAAAAAKWGANAADCRTENGSVVRGKQRLAYGALAADAAKLPVPAQPPLKKRGEYRVLGKPRKRVDGPDIVTGKARYGLDVRLPGMLYAVVARPAAFGSQVKSFDASKAKAIGGVRNVLQIPSGVAVVADNTWAALRGRDALSIEWTKSERGAFESPAHAKALEEATGSPGITIRKDGRGRAGFGDAAKTIEALYGYPFAAHASVEPVNSTALVTDGRCEIWSPSQTPNGLQLTAARLLEIQAPAVTVHVTLLGGGFGRRLGTDFDREAIEIARQMKGTPVQVVWTRDDDIRDGYFQAASAHRMSAGIDPAGKVVAWEHRKASTPHNARGAPSDEQKRNPDWVRGHAWGVYDSPYAIRDSEMTYAVVDAPVPIGPWRAVFAPSSVFAREAFLDELAAATGKDPIDLRLELLGVNDPAIPKTYEIAGVRIDRPRLARALEEVAKKSGWRSPAPKGVARGVACDYFHNGASVAYVVEVSLRPEASDARLPFSVDRVVCAIDCGLSLNPNGIAQQVESGVIWSLSNLKSEITFANGRARESNYDDFPVVMIDETPPVIETHIVANDDPGPRGIGEPTVSPFAPAVVSALSRRIGKRLRRLPVRAADLRA